jgi:hypothetical protein
MKGDATLKPADGHMVSLPNLAVWRFIGCACSKVELRIQRLRFWQRMAKDIDMHSPVLYAMFAELGVEREDQHPCERDGKPTDCAHPWLLQLQEDLIAVGSLDSMAFVSEFAGPKPILIFIYNEIKEDFLSLDLSELRAEFLSVRIPPPEWESPEQTLQERLAEESPHICYERCADESVCLKAFTTHRALRTHQTRSRGGTHGALCVARLCAINNQCPACKCTFSNREGAKRHLVRAMAAQTCRGRGNRYCLEPIIPSCLDCPVCDESFQVYEHLQNHILLQHLPAIADNIVLELGSSSSDGDLGF